jgi:hypothetical protein
VKLLIKLHEKLATLCKESIDFVFPIRMNDKELFRSSEYIKPALKRGVRVRALTGGTTLDLTDRTSKSNFKITNFEHRFLPESIIPFGMHIFDNQEVTLAISSNPMPSLWTNNLHVVNLAAVYFEKTWKRSSH